MSPSAGAGAGDPGAGGVATGGSETGGSPTGEGATGGSGSGGAGTALMGGQGGTIDVGSGGQSMNTAGAGGGESVALSIDFVGGRSSTGAGPMTFVSDVPMSVSEVAGVKPAAQWNGAVGPIGSLPNLTLSNNVVTTAAVSWTSQNSAAGPGVWNHKYAETPGDVRMMNGYLDPLSSSSPATVTVSNLPIALTTSGYDVYVYSSGEITTATTRTCRYAIGNMSYTVTEVGPTSTTFPGFTEARDGGKGNYMVFRKLTSASFTLVATPGTTATPRAPINGIQIVSPPGL